jgi:hypothetical protein
LLTVQLQRFCPLCDRSFQDGEAVLRCEGCGVMHHPGCWVTNNGCATQTRHKVTPLAQAYATARPLGAQAPHPGEGVRVGVRATGTEGESREPVPLRPAAQAAEPAPWPVIGGQHAPNEAQRRWGAETVTPPSPPRRYVPPPGEGGSARKPLPKIYAHHRIIGYWYVPAALAVALLVALGVIWSAERLFGGGDSKADSAATPAPGPSQAAAAQPTAAGTAKPGTTGTVPATGGTGRFRAGDTVVVAGAGDCLNVRTAPGKTNAAGVVNPAIVCLNDGTEVKVTGGPETAGDLTWWKVQTALGEGWAAEDYLIKK